MRTSKVDPREFTIRSRARAVATTLALLLCGAGTYRMTHDILRVRSAGEGASIALALDQNRAPEERRDGAVLMTNEIYQRILALQALRAQGADLGDHARNMLADIVAEASR